MFGISMFIRSYIFLFLFIFNYAYSNATDKELFVTANNLYSNSKFEEAFDVYKRIKNRTAVVNYNLGNCAYKLLNYPYALLYWRRAESMWGVFGRSDLLYNLDYLRHVINDLEYTSKRGFLKPFIRNIKNYAVSLVRSLPLYWFQLLFLFCCFVLVFTIRLLGSNWRSGWMLFSFLLVFIIFAEPKILSVAANLT